MKAGPSNPAPDAEEPPSYEDLHHVSVSTLSGTADATDDGRIAVNVDSKIARTLAKVIDIPDEDEAFEPPPVYSAPSEWKLPMNIAVQVVGSRGDVQPFVALGNELQKSGHRVRIATHAVFKEFVRSAGLEFYPIGGNPSELMAYMVKNPGLIPNLSTLKSGEIKRKRQMMAEIMRGCWRSCIDDDPDSGAPFVANAIIANPVSFAHVHCAQALSIPLHLVFTMPWSPTKAYPHPLANIQNTTTDPKLANYLSYYLVSALTWQGLGDVVNDFRKDLDLPVIPMIEGPFILETLKISYTYCWSHALVPKPRDWREHISVSGFIFRRAHPYEPPEDLAKFLATGPTPIYIGFGSIVVEDPDALLNTVLEAVEQTGVRAIISKGWSNLSRPHVSPNVFFIGDCPHEWLFQQVCAVVHHGGAGTCAAGLLSGRPTVVVPFFGDQPFWGERIAAAGAGPRPIPYKKLTAANLADAIWYCLTPEAAESAARISEQMRQENGAEAAVASFHRSLAADALQCDLIPTLPAVYQLTVKSGQQFKISAAAAEVLVQHSKVKTKHLKVYEPNKIDIENKRWDPFTSAASSGMGMSYEVLKHANDIWYRPHTMRKEAVANAKGKNKIAPSSAESVASSSEDPWEGSSKGVTASLATKMVGASAMSIPRLTGAAFKGGMVDVPFALTEGFRNAPKLYGERVPDHKPVTDWKSGAVVGGTEFVRGIGLGLVDIFVQPVKGWKEDGIKGAALGVGKGAIGSAMKTGAGVLSVWGYPAQGIWKSIYDATHGKTRKNIVSARRVHDIYWARRDRVDDAVVLTAFEALTKKPG